MDLESALTFLAATSLENTLWFRAEGDRWVWELMLPQSRGHGWTLTPKGRHGENAGPPPAANERLTPADVCRHLQVDRLASMRLTHHAAVAARQQIAFAQSIVDDAKQRFGVAFVDEACEEFALHCDHIVGVVEGLLEKKSPTRPKLRPIDGGYGKI